MKTNRALYTAGYVMVTAGLFTGGILFISRDRGEDSGGRISLGHLNEGSEAYRLAGSAHSIDDLALSDRSSLPEYADFEGKEVLKSDRELLALGEGVKVRDDGISRRERLRRKILGLGERSARAVSDDAVGAGLIEALLPNEESSSLSSHERVQAIKEAGARGYTQEEQEALFDFLESFAGVEDIPDGLSGFRWMADEYFIALRQQEVVPVNFVGELSAIVANEEQNTVLRDYASQHLGHYHEELSEAGAGSEQLVEIEAQLWAALSEKEGTFAGSALRALELAQDGGRLVGDYDLGEAAQNILASGYSVEGQSVALRWASEEQLKDVLSQENSAVSLKIRAEALLREE